MTRSVVLLFDSDLCSFIRAAKDINGSGGPTNVDADFWRHLLCGKVHEKESCQLAETIADIAKILCTEEVDPTHFTKFPIWTTYSFIPLSKPSKTNSEEGNKTGTKLALVLKLE